MWRSNATTIAVGNQIFRDWNQWNNYEYDSIAILSK